MNEQLAPHGFLFPKQIFIYELEEDSIEDYESRAPGFGFGASYAIPDIYSRSMTVYIYDRSHARIPDDSDDPIVFGEFERAKFEAFSNPDFYDDVDIADEGIHASYHNRRFRYVFATLVDVESGFPRASMMAMTTWKGKFFKVRITQGPGDDAMKDMMYVIDHWAEYLWAISE